MPPDSVSLVCQVLSIKYACNTYLDKLTLGRRRPETDNTVNNHLLLVFRMETKISESRCQFIENNFLGGDILVSKVLVRSQRH